MKLKNKNIFILKHDNNYIQFIKNRSIDSKKVSSNLFKQVMYKIT